MEGCYSWAYGQHGQGQGNVTEYYSYAKAIAKATTLCAPCSSSQGCGPATTIAVTVSFTAIVPPTGDAEGRNCGRKGQVWYLLMAAFWAVVLEEKVF